MHKYRYNVAAVPHTTMTNSGYRARKEKTFMQSYSKQKKIGF